MIFSEQPTQGKQGAYIFFWYLPHPRQIFDAQAITAHTALAHKIWTFCCIRSTDMMGWQKVRSDDPVPLTLTFWNQNQWASRLLLCQVSSHSDQEFSLHRTNAHPLPRTHIVTKWSLYPRHRTTSSAWIKITTRSTRRSTRRAQTSAKAGHLKYVQVH